MENESHTNQEEQSTLLSGCEPHLSSTYRKKGRWQLSIRGLATMMNVLPPTAISLDAATAALHHTDYFVRYNAAKLLGRRADRDARLIMQEALTKGASPTRASAARFLYGFSWHSALPLIHQALEDTDARVREAAVYALCDYRQIDAYELLTRVLQNETDYVRAAAVWGLREDRHPMAVSVLAIAMQAKDPEVRVKALEVLGINDVREAIPVVREAIGDPDFEVKYAATLSWLELAGEASLPDLFLVIQQTNGESRAAILRGFFHATNYLKIDLTQTHLFETVIQTLTLAFEDDHPTARMAATWPTAWIHAPKANTLLKNAYHSEGNGTVKAHILYVAFNLLSPVGPELLDDGLQSKDAQVRDMAERIHQDEIDGNVARVYT